MKLPSTARRRKGNRVRQFPSAFEREKSPLFPLATRGGIRGRSRFSSSPPPTKERAGARKRLFSNSKPLTPTPSPLGQGEGVAAGVRLHLVPATPALRDPARPPSGLQFSVRQSCDARRAGRLWRRSIRIRRAKISGGGR